MYSQHIYKEYNQDVDELSKRALNVDEGKIYVMEYKATHFVSEFEISIFCSSISCWFLLKKGLLVCTLIRCSFVMVVFLWEIVDVMEKKGLLVCDMNHTYDLFVLTAVC